MSLAEYFAKLDQAAEPVGRVGFPLKGPSPAMARYLRFTDALEDWHCVCNRLDTHFHEWAEIEVYIRQSRIPNEVLVRWRQTTANLRLDIRSFYVFAKIPFIAFSATLFAMSGVSSHSWHSATNVLKRLKRDDAPTLFRDFNAKFAQDLRWFQDLVNFYRNDFVEHPISPFVPTGLSLSSSEGARLSGLTGRGVTEEDEILIAQIESSGTEAFPILPALPDIHSHRLILRYFNVCKNLDKIPEQYRRRAYEMIRRVGLESGELEPLTMRLCEMYAGFISYFAEWKERNLISLPPKN
jgi:hypothetical protein